MIEWVIENRLAKSARPGYSGEQVSQAEVDAWLDELKQQGIKSIICLLGYDQLPFYESLPTDLIPYYRQQGFQVEHIPARDYQAPPLSQEQLGRVWNAYNALLKPTLVHCSAGKDRTGAAVHHIQAMLG